jgi:malate synthase
VLYLMEDMATGEIRLSILWEWVHKGARLTAPDAAPGAAEGAPFTPELCRRLIADEYLKLQAAGNRDVHDRAVRREAIRSRDLFCGGVHGFLSAASAE